MQGVVSIGNPLRPRLDLADLGAWGVRFCTSRVSAPSANHRVEPCVMPGDARNTTPTAKEQSVHRRVIQPASSGIRTRCSEQGGTGWVRPRPRNLASGSLVRSRHRGSVVTLSTAFHEYPERYPVFRRCRQGGIPFHGDPSMHSIPCCRIMPRGRTEISCRAFGTRPGGEQRGGRGLQRSREGDGSGRTKPWQ